MESSGIYWMKKRLLVGVIRLNKSTDEYGLGLDIYSELRTGDGGTVSVSRCSSITEG